MALSTSHLPGHNHPVTVSITNGGNHRHQVDNHAHTQPVHGHTTFNSAGFNADGNGWDANSRPVAINSTRNTGSAGGENTGGSAPYTNYSADHTHGASASCGTTGGGASFSILPPYLRVNMWKRLT